MSLKRALGTVEPNGLLIGLYRGTEVLIIDIFIEFHTKNANACYTLWLVTYDLLGPHTSF